MDFKMKAKARCSIINMATLIVHAFIPRISLILILLSNSPILLLSLVMVLNVFLACSSSPSTEVWIADTGATNHMTTEFGNLSAPTSYIGSETITAANGPGQADRANSFLGPQS
ncbi:uncharacterized protein LOC109947049 [Prunus persica]|uniref:uncharacterized protein LOC109947049 n=1 Tax=Prunus persica TaxID=3760 RepID=UPI0009AB7E0B|nr:uncharacterized protein LOC109947049 [Prunus persica]